MEQKQPKKLYTSRIDRKICGVCGGIAEFCGIDSTIVRLLWLFAIFCLGFGFVAYFIAAMIIPSNPNRYY